MESEDCPCSEMATTSEMDPFSSLVWDPIISGKFGDLVLQNEFVDSHFPVALENQGSSSHLVPFPSDSCLADVVQKNPRFGRNSLGHMDQNSPSHGKRKRKNVEEKQEEDTSRDILNKEEEEEKREMGCKENYIHVRAKRGQATNSHSLAERVRRERISERMKMLQELVPGCNKITGKAVMLDEIINYVQSLQQQVEFLSMKLAAVNPELNVDIQHILSNDILRSQTHGGPNALKGSSSSRPFVDVSSALQFRAHPSQQQNLWNSSEIQSIIQMGFENLGPTGDANFKH